MTEEEWLSGLCSVRPLYDMEGVARERKLRLFTVACCYRVAHALTDERSRAVLEGLEQYVEGKLDHADFVWLHFLAREASDEIEAPLRVNGAVEGNSESAAACAVLCSASPDCEPISQQSPTMSSVESAAFWARAALSDPVWRRTQSPEAAEHAEAAEYQVQSALLRDIFGNPFRPVALNPAWLTSTVVTLARGMYDSRDFSAMPILVDALQDAGCDNDDILDHCRDPMQVHVRGCWVIDLLLDKA